MSFEQLDQTGFRFEETSVEFAILSANFGGGFEANSLVGLSSGLREWAVRIDALPLMEEYQVDAGGSIGLQSRAEYLWDFYLRQMAAGNKSFWFVDVKSGLNYLAAFADKKLSYRVFTATVYGTGLRIRERRERGEESPVAVEA